MNVTRSLRAFCSRSYLTYKLLYASLRALKVSYLILSKRSGSAGISNTGSIGSSRHTGCLIRSGLTRSQIQIDVARVCTNENHVSQSCGFARIIVFLLLMMASFPVLLLSTVEKINPGFKNKLRDKIDDKINKDVKHKCYEYVSIDNGY